MEREKETSIQRAKWSKVIIKNEWVSLRNQVSFLLDWYLNKKVFPALADSIVVRESPSWQSLWDERNRLGPLLPSGERRWCNPSIWVGTAPQEDLLCKRRSLEMWAVWIGMCCKYKTHTRYCRPSIKKCKIRH